MKTKSALQGVLGALVLVPAVGMAAPSYDTFGSFTDATWGGSGIPNDAVAVSRQYTNNGSTITVAMNATQRFNAPPVTHDNAGTFYAQAGTADGLALWNFNFYVDIDSTIGEVLADYTITLFYDFNPAADNGTAGLGTLDLNAFNAYAVSNDKRSATTVQDSQNLMFAYLASNNDGFNTKPTDVATFNANALGEYNFGIAVSQNGWQKENVAMDVQVVPIPAAVWLFGSALVGLAGISRRKQKA
jgi:hypothetical protein